MELEIDVFAAVPRLPLGRGIGSGEAGIMGRVKKK